MAYVCSEDGDMGTVEGADASSDEWQRHNSHSAEHDTAELMIKIEFEKTYAQGLYINP